MGVPRNAPRATLSELEEALTKDAAQNPLGYAHHPKRPRVQGPSKWAIVDSNHGPPPYQSGALTN